MNRQRTVIDLGDESKIELFGLCINRSKLHVSHLLSILTLGFLQLVFYWRPKLHARCISKRCDLEYADMVLICDEHFTWSLRRVQFLHPLPNQKLSIPTADCQLIDCDSIRFFTFRKLKYFWQPNEARFAPIYSFDHEVQLSRYRKLSGEGNGLTAAEITERRQLYGKNLIDVQLKPLPVLLFKEVINPFYVFQVYSVIVWALEGYLVYAVVIVIMSLISIAMNVYQIRTQERNLRDMVHSTSQVEAVRYGGQVQQVCSDMLVPGDIIQIPRQGCILQCDAVLLTGTCIVNESMLTGESVPVTKVALPPPSSAAETLYSKTEHAKHTLFCGTSVLQTRSAGNEAVKAIVIRTGFSTMKGQLVRSIMYPKPVDFRYTKDLFKFIALLAIIACIGLAYSLTVMYRNGQELMILIVRSLDITTIVVAPALPAALTIGIIAAQMRLKNCQIFCISPSTINTCGAINAVCFDKTGTLTEDGLDFHCARPATAGQFDDEIREFTPKDQVKLLPLMEAMASCHSLARINDQLCGDPLELTLFEKTGWTMAEVDGAIKLYGNAVLDHGMTQETDRTDLEILQHFTFSSTLQRMSVIVKSSTGNAYIVFCKGSPEKIGTLSKSETIPADFEAIIDSYAKRGFRLLAIASRPLSHDEQANIKTLKRESVECNLDLLGLIALENRLKPPTTAVISQLSRSALAVLVHCFSAKIRPIMVTGDNLLTAISVARDCRILKSEKRHFVLETDRNVISGHNPLLGDAPRLMLVENNFDSKKYPGNDMQNGNDGMAMDYQLACSGSTFSIVTQHYPELLDRIICTCDLYARMSPDQKQALVNHLQHVGYTVAMCGDGANDCGALKAAHAGISLTEAEASIAAPFTSKTPDIRCVPTVIREGRAALVTSFGVFKFMAGYSLTQFITVAILRWFGITLPNNQFLYIDLLLATVFAAFFGYTEAAEQLASEPPPTRLLSLASGVSIAGQLTLIALFQATATIITINEPWYNAYTVPAGPDTESMRAMLGTSIFSFSLYQYVMLAVVYSKALPYRKPIFKNKPFCASLIIMTGISTLAALRPPDWVIWLLEYDLIPDFYRNFLVVFSIFSCVIGYLYEQWMVEWLVSGVVNRWRKRRREKATSPDDPKTYMQILRSLNPIEPTWLLDGNKNSTAEKRNSDAGGGYGTFFPGGAINGDVYVTKNLSSPVESAMTTTV